MGQVKGRCLCGAISYECEAEPLTTLLCHCRDCQRNSGGAGSVNVVVPRDALQLSGDGVGRFETVGAENGERRERLFCSACGSPLVTYAAEVPQLALVKGGTLDDVSWLEPATEIWCESAQPWTGLASERVRKTRGLASADATASAPA